MGIGQFISDLAVFVPPWVLAVLGAVIAVLALPGWLTGLKVKKVKAVLRKTVRAGEEERLALQDEALALARGKGEVMLALVREADKLNQPRLRDRAIDELDRMGTHTLEVRKLKNQRPDPTREKRFGHPVEAEVFIARLLDNGALEAAREKLAEARERFPDDEGLTALQTRLDEEPAGSTPEAT